jgi:ArsR family transcriptional regulator
MMRATRRRPPPAGAEDDADSPVTLTAAALSRAEAEVLAARLRVVAEPTRLMLLSMIHAAPGGEATVGDLAAPG